MPGRFRGGTGSGTWQDMTAHAIKEMTMSGNTEAGSGYLNNRVGPVMRAGELAEAVAQAAREDNPDREIRVDDKRAYLRIDTDGEMVIRRTTVEQALGRPFRMSELEVDLSSFAGRIENTPDYVRFYYEVRV
jgi:toluene monooxygenase system protein D